jgi:hypothetical protein
MHFWVGSPLGDLDKLLNDCDPGSDLPCALPAGQLIKAYPCESGLEKPGLQPLGAQDNLLLRCHGLCAEAFWRFRTFNQTPL